MVNAPHALWSLNTVKAALGQELFTGTLWKGLWCLVVWYQNPQGIYYKWHHDCRVLMTDKMKLNSDTMMQSFKHNTDQILYVCLTMEACSLTYLVRWRLLALGGSGNHATQLSLSLPLCFFSPFRCLSHIRWGQVCPQDTTASSAALSCSQMFVQGFPCA